MSMWTIALLAVLITPLLVVLIDALPAMRAERRNTVTPEPDDECHDFAVLVPIWGSVDYLENVDFLSAYGGRVVLCTTDSESPEFYRDVDGLASQHGFRVVKATVTRRARQSDGTRTVSSTIRDQVICYGVHTVAAEYVVAVDADTMSARPLDALVGAFQRASLDVASVRVITKPPRTLLGRLQAIEYRNAMRLRRLWPWLLSGACHVARTESYASIMDRHSKFFQGNDAEVGILAVCMNLRVGHITFDVNTSVPERLTNWWRQRIAWAGGEFRLAFINLGLARRFPWFFAYLTGVVMLLLPIRWLGLVDLTWTLVVVYVVYVTLVFYLERRLSFALVIYPLYGAFNSLILVLLSPLSYLTMAIRDRNTGVIHTKNLEPNGYPEDSAIPSSAGLPSSTGFAR